MLIEIEAPDGSIVEFPDGTDDETIKRVMRRDFAPSPVAAAFRDTAQQPFEPNPNLTAGVQTRAFDATRPPVDPNMMGDFAGEQLAASQRTGPGVRNFQGNFIRPVLGNVVVDELDQPIIKDAAGQLSELDPETQVALRDPRSGQTVGFERTPDTDESSALAAGRLMLPGAMSMVPGGTVTRGAISTARSARQAQRSEVAEAFDRINVPPTAAAVSDNPAVQSTIKQLSETLVGGPIRNATRDSLEQTARAAGRIAGTSGTATTPTAGGQAIQRGVERFTRPALNNVDSLDDFDLAAVASTPARATGHAQRSAALYEQVSRQIPQGATGTLQNSSRVFADISASREAAGIGSRLGGQLESAIAETMQAGGRMTYNSMRRLRTEIGRITRFGQADRSLNNSELQRLYGALTDDLFKLVNDTGGSQAGTALRRADRIYSAGKTRIDNVLARLSETRGGIAVTPDAAFESIVKMARAGGRQNTAALSEVKASLSASEWGDVSSAIIHELGRPTPGAGSVTQEIGFSVNTFMTNFNKLTQDARRVLFSGAGREGLETALDDLATVVSAQKDVEALGNSSRTATNAINLSGFAGLIVSPTTTLSVALGAYGTAKFMASPRYVRWLTRATRIRQLPNSARVMASHVVKLEQMLSRDPDLSGAASAVGAAFRNDLPLAAEPQEENQDNR